MKSLLVCFFCFISVSVHSQKENYFSTRLIVGTNFNRTYDDPPNEHSFKAIYYRLGYYFQNEYLYNINKFRTGIGICNSVLISSEKKYYLKRKNILSFYLMTGYKIVNNQKLQIFAELGGGSFLINTPTKTKKNILIKINFTNEYFLNNKISLLVVPTINFLHFYDNVEEDSYIKTNYHSHSIFNIGIGIGLKYSFKNVQKSKH